MSADIIIVNVTEVQEEVSVTITPLVPIVDIRVTEAEDGREIELDNDGTYIRWRYVGDLTWTNLILVSDLEGTDGTSFYWGGQWHIGVYYIRNSVVLYGTNGNMYISVKDGGGHIPTDTEWWNLFMPKGLDGADAVAGKLPSTYVELVAPVGTTSLTFEDISGMVGTITLDEPVEIAVMASFELQTQSGASQSVIEICVNIEGTNHDPVQRYLSGSNDVGIGAIVHRVDELPAGTYTVKLRMRRVSGVATPGVNRAHMLIMAMQGAKGETGDSGITVSLDPPANPVLNQLWYLPDQPN